MDASIKSLTITGTAVDDARRSRQKGGQSRKRRGVIINDGALDEVAIPAEPARPPQPLGQPRPPEVARPPQPLGQPRPPQPLGQPRPPQPLGQPRQSQPVMPTDTARQVDEVKIISLEKATVPIPPAQKVVLNPPKQIRVKLQPKPSPVISPPSINHTRKARKIQLTVSNLNQRFTRAKKVKDETENTTIDSIREYLIQKGVIQEKSKAPEKMLRSMYSDFRILKEGHTL